MKKYLLMTLVVCFLTGQTSCAQNNNQPAIKLQPVETKSKVLTFQVSRDCRDYVLSFIMECRKRGIDTERLSLIKGIYSESSVYSTVFGSTTKKRDYIFINDALPTYLPTLKRAVIYHELCHVISEDDFHISFPYLLQSGENINVEYVIANWEELREELFTYLKEKYPKQ